MSEGSDGNGDPYKKRMEVDLVEVEVEGPDPDRVDEAFESAVAEAFDRYDKHVNGDGRGI